MSATNPQTPSGMVLIYEGMTDLGCRRKVNEDSLGYFPPEDPAGSHLLVIADGVGGSAAGEVASETAVETVGQIYRANGEPADPALALQQAMVEANRVVYQKSATDPRLAGMATTCTCAAIQGETVVLGHVGDCRAYMAVGGELIQLTYDHSMANDYAREGLPLPPEMENMANVLTRWLGQEDDVVVEMTDLMEFKSHNTLIMCSDGLTKCVTNDEILHTASMHLPAKACEKLIKLARERGGPDNITVQIARLS